MSAAAWGTWGPGATRQRAYGRRSDDIRSDAVRPTQRVDVAGRRYDARGVRRSGGDHEEPPCERSDQLDVSGRHARHPRDDLGAALERVPARNLVLRRVAPDVHLLLRADRPRRRRAGGRLLEVGAPVLGLWGGRRAGNDPDGVSSLARQRQAEPAVRRRARARHQRGARAPAAGHLVRSCAEPAAVHRHRPVRRRRHTGAAVLKQHRRARADAAQRRARCDRRQQRLDVRSRPGCRRPDLLAASLRHRPTVVDLEQLRSPGSNRPEVDRSALLVLRRAREQGREDARRCARHQTPARLHIRGCTTGAGRGRAPGGGDRPR